MMFRLLIDRHLNIRLGIGAIVLALSPVRIDPAQATKIERVVSPGGIEAWLVRDH